jgi:outer membrane lipoprotein-sorting protein
MIPHLHILLMGDAKHRFKQYIQIMIKQFTFACAVLVATTGQGWADKLSLPVLSKYLNGLTTVQAQFTQINPDGTLSTGKILIKRPGKIRFEYDPPNNALVMASAGALAIFDPKGNPQPESYPLNKTPLGLLLDKNIDLQRANMVVGHIYDGTATQVSLQDPEHPERGRMDLVFTGPTPELRQWVVHNENGEQTIVVLNDVQRDVAIRDYLFNVLREIDQRKKK